VVLDLRLIRERPETVAQGLAARGGDGELLVRDVLKLDAERRAKLREVEGLKAERNRASEAIGRARRRGEDAAAEMARARETAERIKAFDADVKALDARIDELLL